MDNIVDYLIVLFFIISFLASVFKKKKKQLQKTDQIQNKPTVGLERHNVQKENTAAQKNTSAAKTSFEDILKSMLQVPEAVEEKKSEVDAYYEEALRNSEIAEIYREPERVKIDTSQLQKVKSKKSPNYTEAIKEIKEKHSSLKAIKIRNSLHNTTAIKDYIVMNEILGKPIALRE